MSFERDTDYTASILEIGSGQFITEGADGRLCLGDKEARLLLYDETDAENTLLMLNEERDGCYALVDEMSLEYENVEAVNERPDEGLTM